MLGDKLQYVTRQRNEMELMQDGERIKLLQDTHVFRKKFEDQKLDLHRANKRLEQLELIHEECQSLKKQE